MGVQLYDESTPFIGGYGLLPADGTAWKQLWAQGFADIRIDYIPIVSTAAANHVLRFKISDGSTDHHLGAVTVPAGSGMGTVANFDAITGIMSSVIGGVIAPKGWMLWVSLPVALGAGEEMQVSVQGGIL